MSDFLEEMKITTRIHPCSAHSFELSAGEELVIIDPQGQQVGDLVAFSRDNMNEYMSSGRSIDYASKMRLSTGDVLYSNRSKPMFTILEDTCGRHDFTLTPCSKETFFILYGETQLRPGCEGNLVKVLEKYGIGVDQIPIAFNVFMNVKLNEETGVIQVCPPLSHAGDYIRFRAEMDLVVGLTACSAGLSNNFTYKPIDFRIESGSG
jgi:uncharacterized protein